MLRRAYVLNLIFSLISTAALMSALPSPAGLLASVRDSATAYAQESMLLSPLVSGVISLR